MTQRSEVIRWSIRGIGFALGMLLVAGMAVGVVLAWRVAVIVFISILLGTAIEPVVTSGATACRSREASPSSCSTLR